MKNLTLHGVKSATINPRPALGNILPLTLEQFAKEAKEMRFFPLIDSKEVRVEDLTFSGIKKMIQQERPNKVDCVCTRVGSAPRGNTGFQMKTGRLTFFETRLLGIYEVDENIIAIIVNNDYRTMVYALCRDDFSPPPPEPEPTFWQRVGRKVRAFFQDILNIYTSN
ncbi:MAG: hypothetical protein ACRCZZ_06895 [Phocaeicola sp.]